MNTQEELANHIKTMFHGPNATGVCMKDVLDGVRVEQALQTVANFNSIAKLLFHINYYIEAQLKVLKGGPLDAHDKYSFDMSEITSEVDWQALKDRCFSNAAEMEVAVKNLDDDLLYAPFVLEKYGTYFKNLVGMLEHSHYHLGQMSLLKKMVVNKSS